MRLPEAHCAVLCFYRLSLKFWRCGSFWWCRDFGRLIVSDCWFDFQNHQSLTWHWAYRTKGRQSQITGCDMESVLLSRPEHQNQQTSPNRIQQILGMWFKSHDMQNVEYFGDVDLSFSFVCFSVVFLRPNPGALLSPITLVLFIEGAHHCGPQEEGKKRKIVACTCVINLSVKTESRTHCPWLAVEKKKKGSGWLNSWGYVWPSHTEWQ